MDGPLGILQVKIIEAVNKFSTAQKYCGKYFCDYYFAIWEVSFSAFKESLDSVVYESF